MTMFLGIDPTSSEARASGCAVLDSSGRLVHISLEKSDEDILSLGERWKPTIVAIDSPLGFPKGMCCLEESCACESVHDFKGRVCERESVRRGIPLYFTTKRSIIKKMIYRAIALAREFESRGCEALEVYPYASKVCLFGRPIPPKSKKEGLDFLHQRLSQRIPGLSAYQARLNHDMYDALVAAYTAYLHAMGQTEAIGLEEEARIVLPKLP